MILVSVMTVSLLFAAFLSVITSSLTGRAWPLLLLLPLLLVFGWA